MNVIYSIYCKDDTIPQMYIGRTTRYDLRCRQHERNCNTSELKLYRFIRDHGGWSNWGVKILSEVECRNRGDAALEEFYWYIKTGAELNTYRPGINYFKRTLGRERLYESRKDVMDRILQVYHELHEGLTLPRDGRETHNLDDLHEVCEGLTLPRDGPRPNDMYII